MSALAQQFDVHPHRIKQWWRAPLRDFIERLWRAIKCEEVFLHAYASVPNAWPGIGRYTAF